MLGVVVWNFNVLSEPIFTHGMTTPALAFTFNQIAVRIPVKVSAFMNHSIE